MSVKLLKFRGAGASAFRKRKPTVRGVQAQIKSIKRKLKKEMKITVHNQVAGTLNDTPVVLHHVLGGGTGSNGVVLTGASAILKGLRIKGWFKSVGAVNAPGRLDVVLDRIPVEGTSATYDQIYYPLAAAITVNSMIHGERKGRFKILASFRSNPVTNDGQTFFFDRYIRMNHKIFTDTPDLYGVDSQYKNAILIIHWTDAAANEPTYAYVIQDVIMDDN